MKYGKRLFCAEDLTIFIKISNFQKIFIYSGSHASRDSNALKIISTASNLAELWRSRMACSGFSQILILDQKSRFANIFENSNKAYSN